MISTNFVSGPEKITKEAIVTALGYEPPVNDTQGINLLSNSASGINLIATDHPENTKISNGKYEIIGEEKADAYQWIQNYIDGGVSGFTDKNIYTLSVDIKVTGAKQDLTLILDFRKDLARQTIGTTTVDHTKNGVWVRYAVSCEFLSICNRALASISAPAGCGIGTTVEYRNFKLEPGFVEATQWSPAPEDLVVNDVASVEIDQNFHIRKFGRVVYFDIYGVENIQSYTFPEGFRPIQTTVFTAWLIQSNARLVVMMIHANGNIIVYDPAGGTLTDSMLRVSGSFIAA